MENVIKIILAEDHPDYRRGIRMILEEAKLNVIAEAENGNQLFQLLDNFTPDIILLDLRMPEMDGNYAMTKLMEMFPEKKVIILSSYREQALIEDYKQRGARGYIVKNEVDGEQLVKIIKKVYNGGFHFFRNNEKPPLKLSERQKDIVYYNANHTINKEEVGEKIGMTGNGVGKQEKRIMKKMHVSNIPAYFEYIFEAGLKFLRRPKENRN